MRHLLHPWLHLRSARPCRRHATPLADARPTAPESAGGGIRLLEWIPSQKLLVKTARFVWSTLWMAMLTELAPQSKDGGYLRPAPQLGGGVTARGWPANLPMETGRYHVYLGNACPWCHRVSLALRLRGLDTAISKTVLGDDPARASRGGWFLRAADPDPLDDLPDLKAVYDRCSGEEGGYAGRCTAPLLIDLATETIVSSESADIVRILNSFTTDSAADSNNGRDLYPVELGREIDEANAWVYEQVNNGVYKAGFATKQAAYEAAEREVHAGLARCDSVLGLSRFICGEAVTEADVRLLPTAVRFDAIYAALFRCGRKIIRADYPHVDRWMREMVELAGPGLFDLQAAKTSYYSNLFPLNPGGIVPVGPSAADLGL